MYTGAKLTFMLHLGPAEGMSMPPCPIWSWWSIANGAISNMWDQHSEIEREEYLGL